MHPFLSRTRASMTFCPTTKCRPSNGFRASTSTELHGMWRNSAFGGLPFDTVARSAILLVERAAFVSAPDFLRLSFAGAIAPRFFFFMAMTKNTMPQQPDDLGC